MDTITERRGAGQLALPMGIEFTILERGGAGQLAPPMETEYMGTLPERRVAAPLAPYTCTETECVLTKPERGGAGL